MQCRLEMRGPPQSRKQRTVSSDRQRARSRWTNAASSSEDSSRPKYALTSAIDRMTLSASVVSTSTARTSAPQNLKLGFQPLSCRGGFRVCKHNLGSFLDRLTHGCRGYSSASACHRSVFDSIPIRSATLAERKKDARFPPLRQSVSRSLVTRHGLGHSGFLLPDTNCQRNAI